MKWIANTEQFAVVDDFLSPKDWEEVSKYMQLTSYLHVKEGSWRGDWRLDDGQVMRGPVVGYGKIENAEAKYPTGAGVDLLIKSLLENAKQFSKQIGDPGKTWDSLTATPMLYPRGTGLYWHRDSPKWAGSYTYYVHKEWNVEWGGALMVADASLKSVPKEHGAFLKPAREAMGIQGPASFGAHLDNSEANELLMANGTGSYIFPKPNRLVVISEGHPHTVSKTNDAMGDRLRASISGFFQR